MSRSLFSSALRKTEIERLMCTLRPVFLAGRQSIYGLKLFSAMPIPENRSKLFYGIDFEDFFSGNSESGVLQEDKILSDLKRHSASRFNN